MDVPHLIAAGLVAVCLGGAAFITWLAPKPEGLIDTSGTHQSNSIRSF